MLAIVVLDHGERGMAARINELQRASYAIEAELIGFDGIPGLQESNADVSELDVIFLGAFRERELVGILAYRRLADVVDIDRLAVHPSAFRRGVARSLLSELHGREADARRFEVTTAARNTPAVTFYTNLGYTRASDQDLTEGIAIARFVWE